MTLIAPSVFDRRAFLQVSAATSAFALLPAVLRAQDKGGAKKQLRILILGGTGFLGPAIVRVAQARGHSLTLFNRGRTRTDLFPDVPRLVGNRDPDKDEGIKALEQGEWDVCFDDCGYYPRMVEASAKLLAGRVKHYVFVSSISVYAKNDKENADEKEPVGTIPDPTVETMGEGYANYGPLKALCEQAAERAFPGSCTNIRPGYIVGPEDPTDRFTYWPVRTERGGEMLVPGAASDPIQVIDVRDLAEWMVHVAETRTFGVFNAVGPNARLSMGEVMNACKSASKNDAKFVWVDAEFLSKQEGVDLPIWAAYAGETKGFHTVSHAAALKAGLKSRSIEVTTKDTLAWFKTLPADRQAKLKAGLSPDSESKLLAAWSAHKAKG